jgi:hypothetical protein
MQISKLTHGNLRNNESLTNRHYQSMEKKVGKTISSDLIGFAINSLLINLLVLVLKLN